MCAAGSTAGAQSAIEQVVVTGAAPAPGITIDLDKIPGNVQVLSAADLSKNGVPSLTTALNSQLGSININSNLDDPFQPDVIYRGFEASPVLGTSEGLAVYQDGVRINEAFGDTVNWDLLPAIAIGGVQLVSSSPLYGLNALGGAIALTMKNGFSYQGGDAELSGGSYGQRSLAGQYGMHAGRWGFYLAGKALDWNGWRQFSGDRIRTAYAVASLHTRQAHLNLSLTRADNLLQGAGATPVQELAVNRALVFTGPQHNLNRLDFITLDASWTLARGWSLESVLYYRDFDQSVANGNTTHYTSCATTSGVLCQPDGVTPLVTAAGERIPDLSAGGTLPIGENDFEYLHTWGRGATLQVSNDSALGGHANQLILGAALDYATTSYYSGAQIGALDPQLLVLPSPWVVDTPENSAAALANGDASPVSVDSVNKNLGVFFTDTFNATRALALTVSGRYNVAQVNLADQLGARLSGHNRYVHFNPAIGATYDVLPNVTLYGGLSQNTRTPTPSEIECSDPSAPCLLPTSLGGDPPNLRQVVATTSELGVRGKAAGSGDSPGAISWNLSVFRTALHDDIYGIATSISQGFFRNIGDTRRQGVEADLNYRRGAWSADFSYSLVQASFESPLVMSSSSNPFADANGDIHVRPGDRLPGIPEHRVKLGVEYAIGADWSVGASMNWVSSFYYLGDQSNQLAPIPGYAVVDLHALYVPTSRLELFASVDNALNRRYATSGLLGDPTGVGAPGVPAGALPNGPGVDNRFLNPAAPFEISGGVRITL